MMEGILGQQSPSLLIGTAGKEEVGQAILVDWNRWEGGGRPGEREVRKERKAKEWRG